jgi:hypothetical protein
LTLSPIGDTVADVVLVAAVYGRPRNVVEPAAHIDVHGDGPSAAVRDAVFGW